MRLLQKSLAPALAVLAMAGAAWTLRAQDRGDAGAHQVEARRPSVPAVHGLVTSAHPLASMAGMRILTAGGNAVDAAVAVAATLNVVEPQSSGIGGNGFMVLFEKSTGAVHSLNMTGAAPRAANPGELDAEALSGGMKAGIVPGVLGGLIRALDRFGTRSLAEVLAPAIEYARDGHPINASLASTIERRSALFQQFPTTAALLMPGGRVPNTGELFEMPALAATLEKLVEAERTALTAGESRSEALDAAFDRFYQGDIAQEVARFFAENGGLLTLEDLESYSPSWTEPIHTTYRGYDVYSNPSTSRGGYEVLMQLNLLEAYDVAAMGFGSADAIHLMAEAIKLAKADVYQYVADPSVTDIPEAGLLSKEYAALRRQSIRTDRAMPYPESGTPAAYGDSAGRSGPHPVRRLARAFPETYEPSYDTTSFSIVDPAGNAVACTPTVGGIFGNGVVAGNTGLFLNNGMRLGSTAPYPDNVNYLDGGQIPLLNNSPLIVLKDSRLVLAVGTPGGETIGQTQFQVLVNILDFGLTIQEAIEAPRFRLDPDPNFYKPGAAITLAFEDRLDPTVIQALTAKGHAVERLPEFTAGVGGMQGVLVDLENGTMTGGADPRRAGYAIGW